MSLISISVDKRSGVLVRFQVTERTRYRSHGGTTLNIRNIDSGMWVGVGGIPLDDDELLAEAIQVFLRRL